VFAAGPRGIEAPVEYGWVHTDLLPDNRWSIAPAGLLERLERYVDPEPAPFVLAPRREMAWSNSIAYGANERVPVARINIDATAIEDVVLATEHGTVTTTIVADATVRAGVVSMTHGHADANPGDLTSGEIAVDPLTAMPRVSGLAVELRSPASPTK
jgi:hypothetical protein